MLNKNERNGLVDQVTGKAKQAVGAVTGDDRLKTEGRVDEAMGKMEAAVGKLSRRMSDAITHAGDAAKE